MSAGRKNLYVCDCGHATATIELVDGVTPFLITCREPDCYNLAQSQFGNVCQDLEPNWEWYRPERDEFKNLLPGELEHVRQGGLLLRKRTPETIGAETKTAANVPAR